MDEAGFDSFVGELIRLSGAQLGQLAEDLNGISVAIEAISKFGRGDFEGLKELNEEVKAGDQKYEPLPGFGWTADIGEWLATQVKNIAAAIGRIDWSAIMPNISGSLAAWGQVFQGDIRGALQKALDIPFNQWIIEMFTGKKISGQQIVDALGLNGDWNHDFARIGDLIWTGLQDALNFEGAFALDDWLPDIGAGISNWWNTQASLIAGLWNTITTTLGTWWNSLTQWLSDLFSGNDASSGLAGTQGTTSLLDGFNFEGIGEELGRRLEIAKAWISSK